MNDRGLPTFVRQYIAIFRSRGLIPEVEREHEGKHCFRIRYVSGDRTLTVWICQERTKPRVGIIYSEGDEKIEVATIQEGFARLTAGGSGPVKEVRPGVSTVHQAARTNAVTVRRAAVIRT